jgi:hypothetical protein
MHPHDGYAHHSTLLMQCRYCMPHAHAHAGGRANSLDDGAVRCRHPSWLRGAALARVLVQFRSGPAPRWRLGVGISDCVGVSAVSISVGGGGTVAAIAGVTATARWCRRDRLHSW